MNVKLNKQTMKATVSDKNKVLKETDINKDSYKSLMIDLSECYFDTH